MVNHIRELEKLLAEKGVEVKPFLSQLDDSPLASCDRDMTESGWTQLGSLWIKDHSTGKDDNFIISNFPRHRLESRPDDSSLPVEWGNHPMSSIRGTKLNIMGITIDTASFDAPDVDEPTAESGGVTPLYNKSVQAFLQSAVGINPPVHVELPSREDAFTYTKWYFLIMSCYFPVLHRPTFMKLVSFDHTWPLRHPALTQTLPAQLTRMYDEPDFIPSTAELVQVHMVFSIIYYQYGVRNWQQSERRTQLNNLSNKHYHFSLSKIFDLMTSRDLPAVQAMVLMVCHARAFPKPGCGALISNLVFQRALELNLHRAPRVPPEGTNLQIEMHKRTWWVMISMYVHLSGHIGRPMPIAVHDFDVPFPEPVNDEAITEGGIDASRNLKCDWEVAMAMFKLVPLVMEMYSNIYSVRRDPQNYSKIIYILENELEKWENDLPPGLKFNHEDYQQNDLSALYARQFGLEMRMWMRHNSVNPTTDKTIMAKNTQVCEQTARELLHLVLRMIELKALDTTWTRMSLYAMSIFSMLEAHWERRFQTTPEQVAMLQREMDDWTKVLNEASQLLCECLFPLQ